jgi:hypothetical protein
MLLKRMHQLLARGSAKWNFGCWACICLVEIEKQRGKHGASQASSAALNSSPSSTNIVSQGEAEHNKQTSAATRHPHRRIDLS